MDDVPDDEPLEQVVLHVANTRPAMILGIPWMVFVPLALACVEIEMALGFRMACFLDPPLAVAVFIMVLRDYNAPRLWRVWLGTKARVIDGYYFGGAAVSPLPVKLPRRPRGIPSDAW